MDHSDLLTSQPHGKPDATPLHVSDVRQNVTLVESGNVNIFDASPNGLKSFLGDSLSEERQRFVNGSWL